MLGTADKFTSTTDKGLQDQLKQLHMTLLNLKVVTTYAKELVENLAEKPNRIIFSGNRSRPRSAGNKALITPARAVRVRW